MIKLNLLRIVVTGGAGFLGRHVVQRLLAAGCQLFVPRSEHVDLTQGAAIRDYLAAVRPDVVIHLAARVGGIGANRAQPATFFYDNAMMGIQLLHECQRAGVQKFLAVATVCGYPKHTPVPFRESDLWNGYPEETNAPYGIAKKILSVQSQAYRDQYGFNSVVVYPVNLYGPGDNFDPQTSHVIPAMLRKLHEAKETNAANVVLWGDGSPTREFLYVEDCADAIVRAVEDYDSSAPLNLGSGQEISIHDLATLSAKIVGYKGPLCWDASQPNGQPRRKLDTSRAETLLGFRASTQLEDGLRRTYEWFVQGLSA